MMQKYKRFNIRFIYIYRTLNLFFAVKADMYPVVGNRRLYLHWKKKLLQKMIVVMARSRIMWKLQKFP